MNPAHCVDCGTERDASFIERDGQRVAIQCLACEASHPCCPACGTFKTKRAEDKLQCSICADSTFPDPKIKVPKRKLTADEVHFLLDVGKGLSLHISKLRSFDQYEEKLGKEISETRYIYNELKYFIVIPRLLDWRQQALSGKFRLPDIDYIAKKLLAESYRFKPSNRIRTNRANDLRGILGQILKLYKGKRIPPSTKLIILLAVDSELHRGADYKAVLHRLEHESAGLDVMKYDPMFVRYKRNYGISDWIDIIENKKASATFQTWLSRQRKRLKLGQFN